MKGHVFKVSALAHTHVSGKRHGGAHQRIHRTSEQWSRSSWLSFQVQHKGGQRAEALRLESTLVKHRGGSSCAVCRHRLELRLDGRVVRRISKSVYLLEVQKLVVPCSEGGKVCKIEEVQCLGIQQVHLDLPRAARDIHEDRALLPLFIRPCKQRRCVVYMGEIV